MRWHPFLSHSNFVHLFLLTRYGFLLFTPYLTFHGLHSVLFLHHLWAEWKKVSWEFGDKKSEILTSLITVIAHLLTISLKTIEWESIWGHSYGVKRCVTFLAFDQYHFFTIIKSIFIMSPKRAWAVLDSWNARLFQVWWYWSMIYQELVWIQGIW